MITKENMITAIEDIEPALQGKESNVLLYWDDQDPNNEGPAWRTKDGEQSGSLEFCFWNNGQDHIDGYNIADFFRGPGGAYLGPDGYDIYPVFEPL